MLMLVIGLPSAYAVYDGHPGRCAKCGGLNAKLEVPGYDCPTRRSHDHMHCYTCGHKWSTPAVR